MFHNGDTVEEIATKQQGTVELVQIETGNVITRCTVRFVKGNNQRVKTFTNAAELRLMRCPHSEPEPGFSPADPIM